MTSPAHQRESAQPDGLRWIALAIVMTAAFMDLVDVTIVNIAVPSILRDTGASFSQIQWIVAGYSLTFAVGLITGGRLGDIYGRKRIFLVGVTGFTLASGLCGFAVNAEMLLVSRLAQGCAAALMVPQVLSIVHATFPAHERGKVFGLFGAITGLAGVSGPLLGALLTQWDLFGLAWRPIFLVNVPVGVASVLLGRRFISESRSSHALRLDLVGVAIATAGLLMLLYPLTRGHDLDWPLWSVLSMVGSVVAFGGLVAYERVKARKDGSPLIELSLFRVKSFRAGILVQLAAGIAFGVFFLVWTLYMQVGLGWSVLRAGLMGVPFSIAVAAAAGISVQVLVPRWGRAVLQAGALAMAAGMLLYVWEADRYGLGISPWWMVPPLVVMGIGMGLILAPLTDAVLAEVPREHSGSASGLINTTLQVGLAMGLGLTSLIFFGTIGSGLAPQSVGPAFADAFAHSLKWSAGLMAVVFLLMYALPAGPRSRRDGDVDDGEPWAMATGAPEHDGGLPG
ncbi:MFS transporter [Streptomyces poonensis]|uniref:MFS transporter n=1 Tax=Streptomyces poonensis TaxID=68255 RepID=A0A918PE88_9ACTN|nr:MFS transporter [Streptomyces poonensis]GGZ01543.1 MFS transporter [Streptomyces poonensis]GLJ90316.1 MFS transporter [Streptomyces poonensis]